MPVWITGHTKQNTTANANITKNPITQTKQEPLNTPSHSGSLVSKYLLCKYTTTPATTKAPTMLVSNVLILATNAKPVPLPASTA